VSLGLGFLVSGELRLVETALWRELEAGSSGKPAEGYSCDGCSLSPDWWRGRYLWPACVIHDWDYREGRPDGATWADRRDADARLRRNLSLVLRHQGASRVTAGSVAWLYWGRVRIWGAANYAFATGEQPLSRWQRFREAYGLFRDGRVTG